MIVEAFQSSCFSVVGVFGVKLRLDSLPLLIEDVGVRRQILSFDNIRSGQKGTQPAAAKTIHDMFPIFMSQFGQMDMPEGNQVCRCG